MSDLKHTAVRTRIRRLDAAGVAAEIEETFVHLEAEVGALFAEEGVHKDIVLTRMADVRYYGQEHTIRVPLASGTVTQASLVGLGDVFSEHHEKEYGFTLNTAIELVNAVIVGTATVGKPVMQSDTAPLPQVTEQASSRAVYWQDLGEITTPILQRAALTKGEHVSGPAIIEEATSTVVVPPDFTAFVDPHYNLILQEKRR
jgi:N-methylhydantoinase A